MKIKQGINNIHELMEFGLQLHKTGLLDKVTLKLKLPKEAREQVFSDMLDYNVDYNYYDKKNYYDLTLLGIHFNIY